MKTPIHLLFVLTIFFLAVGCKDDKNTPPPQRGDPPAPSYQLLNQSGHTVAIVHKPSCMQMPDSLVLLNSEDFIFHAGDNHYGKLYIYDTFETEVIYYDQRYILDLNDLPQNRDLRNTARYKSEADPYTFTFTLTEEDYDYAVKNGTDLGENIP